MATYPVPAVGQRLTAEFVASMLPDTVRKGGDTTTISDATVNADPDLALALVANAVYEMSGLLIYTSAVAADFKFQFTGPAGFGGDMAYQAIITASAAGSYADDQTGHAAIASAAPTVGGGAANIEVVKLNGTVTTAGTAGTLTLNWCQGTSTASNTVLKTGSYLKLTRIA